MTHALKTTADIFEAMLAGDKTFELRKDDRPFSQGDKLLLQEITDKGLYTGRELDFEITFVLRKFKGLNAGYCILSYRKAGSQVGNFIKDVFGPKSESKNLLAAVLPEWPTPLTDVKPNVETSWDDLLDGAHGTEQSQQVILPPAADPLTGLAPELPADNLPFVVDVPTPPSAEELPATQDHPNAVPAAEQAPPPPPAPNGPAQATNPDDDFPF